MGWFSGAVNALAIMAYSPPSASGPNTANNANLTGARHSHVDNLAGVVMGAVFLTMIINPLVKTLWGYCITIWPADKVVVALGATAAVKSD